MESERHGRGWSGVRMKREYENGKGYFMDFEPMYIDVEWALMEISESVTISHQVLMKLLN